VQRLTDYGTVLLVVVAMMGLFRLSRLLLGRILAAREARGVSCDCDDHIRLGFFFLLAGMLLLPLATAAAACIDSTALAGGVFLHLPLVAVSIVFFSLAEDLFAGMKKRPASKRLSTGAHFRTAGPLLLGFWALGSAFLSPIFYTALTLILGLFYLFALAARPDGPSA